MKKFLSMVMALAMTVSLVTISAGAKDFTDKSSITYQEAVDVISSLSIVDGYTDGSYNPTGTLTRGAAAKIICNLVLGPTTASALGVNAAPFTDVSVNNVFAGYIAYCSQQGIINGYGDGTFKPAATVTGYQFMKMLLGALGYDGAIEGFTGSNWTVAVAKLAIAAGLDDGNDSFIGSKAMTRQEAALYAFNTLTANVVAYSSKGTQITVNGATIVTGATEADTVKLTTGTDYTGNAESGTGADSCGTQQFCEKYFPKLTQSGADADKFGRPAHEWLNKTTSIGTYAEKAVATFTTSTKASAVASALKGYSLPDNTTPTTVYYKVENTTAYVTGTNPFTTAAILSQKGVGSPATALTVGAAGSGETTAKALADETGNGKLVEVYANDNKQITKIVEVTYTVGKVTNVSTSSTKTTYTVDGHTYVDYPADSVNDDTIVLGGGVSNGDYVTYVDINGTGYVYPTTTVSGAQSAYNTSDSTITVSGTTYDVGLGVTGVAMNNFTNSTTAATYFVDQYGNVVKTTASAAYGDYAYIVGTYGTTATTVDGTVPTAQVKAALANGTVATYNLKLHKITADDVAAGGAYAAGGTYGATSSNTFNIDSTPAAVTFAEGDYVLYGTAICVYDKNATDSNTSANITTAIGNLGAVVGYSLSGTTMTAQKLSAIGTSMTVDTSYLGTSDDVGYNATYASINSATALINSVTKYVVYDSDAGTAAVYTGNTGLPNTATVAALPVGNVVAKATSASVATANVIFVTKAGGVSAAATDNYVYIDSSKNSVSLNGSDTVYTYTGYKADGSTISLTSSSALTKTGVFVYNTDNTVKDDNNKATTSTTTFNGAYVYGSSMTLSNTLLGVAGSYYNVTDSTLTYYVNSDVNEVNGHNGYVVLKVDSSGNITKDVAAIFITG